MTPRAKRAANPTRADVAPTSGAAPPVPPVTGRRPPRDAALPANPALGQPLAAPRPVVPTRTDLPSAPRPPSVRIPPELAERYCDIEELGHGGQALVMSGRDARTGERVALKYHVQLRRPGAERHAPDASVGLDHPGLVRTLEAGLHDGHWWEVMEFCGGGTLADLIESHPGGAPPDRVREVVSQITEALDYLHTRGIVHRDLKPENVLLREGEALSIALADFGTAVQGEAGRSVAVRSAWVSAGYAPVDGGRASSATDFWALGIMVVELAIGHHPLWVEEITDPLAPRAEDIAAFLHAHEVPLAELTDPRLRLLAEGLLTRDRARRWGAAQVRDWLAGGSPPVAPRKATSLDEVRVHFSFAGRPYTSPAELGLDMAANWRPAMRLIAGRGFDDLVRWLLPTSISELATAIQEQYRAGAIAAPAALARLLIALNPAGPHTFGEVRAVMTQAGLLQLAHRAIGGDPLALRTVGELFDSDALSCYAIDDDPEDLARLMAMWRQAVSLTVDEIERAGKQIEQDLAAIEADYKRIDRTLTIPDEARPPQVTDELRREIEAQLLGALLSSEYAQALAEAAQRAATPAARSRPWFRRLLSREGQA